MRRRRGLRRVVLVGRSQSARRGWSDSGWTISVQLGLPRPTGAFAVGRASYTSEQSQRVAFVTCGARGAPAADYFCHRPFAPSGRALRPTFINFLTRDLAKVHGHSADDVPISNAQPQYPVAILRAGGSGSALNFSSLAKDLGESHGHIVVGLDMTTTANPEHCVGRDDEEECATKIMASSSAASAVQSIGSSRW